MTEKQKEILQRARSYIGLIEYQYQLQDEEATETKTNCARFTQLLYRFVGINIGPSSIDQAADNGKEIETPEGADQLEHYNQLLASLQAGDLIFFEGTKGRYNHKRFRGQRLYIGHVALYSGDGNVIHCFRDADYGLGEIKEEPLWKIIEKKGPVVIIKRVLD